MQLHAFLLRSLVIWIVPLPARTRRPEAERCGVLDTEELGSKLQGRGWEGRISRLQQVVGVSGLPVRAQGSHNYGEDLQSPGSRDEEVSSLGQCGQSGRAKVELWDSVF